MQGFTRWMLKETRDGKELGDLLLNIARNAQQDRDKLEAIKILLDRLFGRADPAVVQAVQAVAVAGLSQQDTASIRQQFESSDE